MTIDRLVIPIDTLLLDRYKVLKLIDQGGMQQVYFAHDMALDRDIVVKTPINSSAQKRFEQSARLSAGVSHPNVAKTLDYAIEGDIEFLVEEFVDGENLQQRLDKDFDYLDPFLAAHVMHHVAKAVKSLSASNIMVSPDPGMSIIKVTDFGVAKLAEEEINSINPQDAKSITASKTMVGALPYMAPELLRKKASLNKTKADVWAVGALLYKVLFGVFPFPSDDIVECVMAISSGQYTDQSSFIGSSRNQFKGLLTQLWDIVTKCLVVDVDKRLDPDQLSQLLENICYNSDKREFGRITFIYDGPGNIGTITTDSGKEVFVHFGSYYSQTKPTYGQRVLFSRYSGKPRDRAFPVLKCKSL